MPDSQSKCNFLRRRPAGKVVSFSRQRKFHDELYAADRYQIYRCLKLGLNQQEIAHQLKRHPSTISREIKRNTGLRGYRAKQGHIRIISTIA